MLASNHFSACSFAFVPRGHNNVADVLPRKGVLDRNCYLGCSSPTVVDQSSSKRMAVSRLMLLLLFSI